MDGQDTASFIGQFLNSFMSETKQLEKDKAAKVNGLLDIADRYRKIAEDPDATQDVYTHAQEMWQKFTGDADKLYNQKGSNFGSVMKIFGLGKKGATIPREMFAPQGGSAGTPPAAMPRPGAMGDPAPDSAPAEFSGPNSLGMFQQAAVGAPASSPAALGPIAEKSTTAEPWLHPAVRREREKMDYDAKQREASALREAEIRRRFSQEDYNWQRDQTQQETDRKVAAYESSPEYARDTPDDRDAIKNYLRFGIPYRPATPRPKTEFVRDEKTQTLIQRTTDLSSGKIMSEEPYSAKADEPYIQALIAESAAKGEKITAEEAAIKLGNIRLSGLRLGNKSKEEGLKNQEERLRLARERAVALKKKQDGTLTPKEANALITNWRNFVTQNYLRTDPAWGMQDTNKKEADVQSGTRTALEEGGFNFAELQSIATRQPVKGPEDELKGFTPRRNNSAPAQGTKPSGAKVLAPPKKNNKTS